MDFFGLFSVIFGFGGGGPSSYSVSDADSVLSTRMAERKKNTHVNRKEDEQIYKQDYM